MSRAAHGRRPRGRAAAWGPLLVLAAGCAGVSPTPRYTGVPAAERELARELEARQRALQGADPARLQRVVDSYLGVPYRWGGATRSGMDCSALTRAVFREAYGLELPRNSAQMYRLGRPVALPGLLRAGDLVFFRLEESGPGVSHVGIYIGGGRFAHASASRGSAIDPLAAPYYERRYAGARRLLP